MVLFDSTCINDDEEHAYFLQIQLIIYKARYPGSTSVSLPLKFNSWSKLKFHIALELVIIIAISPTHHQETFINTENTQGEVILRTFVIPSLLLESGFEVYSTH